MNELTDRLPDLHAKPMEDLYALFRKRLACGRPSLHPHRWLLSHAFGSIAPSVLDCKFQTRSLFELVGHLPLAIIDGVEITNAKLGLRALRRLGRQSAPAKYLAHASLAFQYWTHEPMVGEVQHALHDFLAETIDSLKLEVPCPTGKVDCVTPRAVIEVAPVRAWKAAMGQLLAYAPHFADRRLILWLFGEDSFPNKIDVIRRTCGGYRIVVAYTRCSSSAFGRIRRERHLPPGPQSPAPVHGCGGDREECTYYWLEEASRPHGTTLDQAGDGSGVSDRLIPATEVVRSRAVTVSHFGGATRSRTSSHTSLNGNRRNSV